MQKLERSSWVKDKSSSWGSTNKDLNILLANHRKTLCIQRMQSVVHKMQIAQKGLLVSLLQNQNPNIMSTLSTTTLRRINLTFLIIILSICGLVAQSILPNDANIHYVGRIDWSDSLKPTYIYPGVTVAAKFNGTGISAKIHDYGTGGASTTNYYKVIIDGAIYTEQLKMNSGEDTYVLASGLTAGDHVVELMKITEGASGKSSFRGFTVEGGNQSLLPYTAPNVGKKIEFIGDSWTCGFGNLSQYSTGGASMANGNYVAANEDNYYAWRPITARAIGAEYHVTATSGRGLYRNNTGSMNNTIPKNYDNILEDDASVAYAHDWHPDVISIHLGTNDLAQEEGGAAYKLDDAAFEKTYLDFVSKLLTLHPCAQVIICIGNSKTDSWPAWTKQLTRLRTIANNVINIHNKGNVHLLELPFTAEKWTGNKADDCGYGDAWHPSKCSHEEMSVKLVEKIYALNVNWGNQSGCPVLADTSLWQNTHVSTKEINGQNIRVYPNPTHGIVNIDGPVDQYQIINGNGLILEQGQLNAVNLTGFAKGIYVVRYLIEGVWYTERIIKQ